jgi:hypothetical protein
MGEMAMALAMAASGGRSVVDSSFEFALERMFAETPARPDADFFAARVLERLDRGWTARRLLIGSMGALPAVRRRLPVLGLGRCSSCRPPRRAPTISLGRPSTCRTDVAGAVAPRRLRLSGQSLGWPRPWRSSPPPRLARLVREMSHVGPA